MIIRRITSDDAAVFLDLCRTLDRETTYMMYEPDERTTTTDEQRENIEEIMASSNSVIIVADTGDRLVGYVAAYGGAFIRTRHSAYVVAGVRRQYAGQGLGTQLFKALDSWAIESGIQRLELTVRADNTGAIRLYQRMGFDIEGTKRHSLLVDGQLVDELYMGKLFDNMAEGSSQWQGL